MVDTHFHIVGGRDWVGKQERRKEKGFGLGFIGLVEKEEAVRESAHWGLGLGLGLVTVSFRQ